MKPGRKLGEGTMKACLHARRPATLLRCIVDLGGCSIEVEELLYVFRAVTLFTIHTTKLRIQTFTTVDQELRKR